MDILILGGTQFLGRHLTEAALKAGHQVTLFNRGKTNPGLFPQVEQINGDRNSDLSKLAGRRWDAAIDTCGYIPRHVRDSATALADAVEHYTFISTISVYDGDRLLPNMDESGPLSGLEDETTEEVNGATYGGLKVLCEQAAEAAMPGRVLQVRSGLIVGPHDPTDRFTYWPVRLAMGGNILAPGGPNRRVQIIDGRDQAEWIIRMAEARQAGTYNVTGPDYPLTIGDVINTSQRVTGSHATIVWASDEFLLEQNVQPFMEMPLWVPERYNAIQMVNVDRALQAGLTFRPLEQTIQDTLRWNATRAPSEREYRDGNRRGGLMQAREAELLTAWSQRSGG
jgi:2'-hydroxyisoflavone reductase